VNKKSSDTRALTEEAVPHILAEGRNPSVAEVKDWVRTEKGMPDWNPSSTTIQDELNSIRARLGKALLQELAFPGIDSALAVATGEYFKQIHEIIKQSAWSDLQVQRDAAEQKVEAACKRVEDANALADEASRRLDEATTGFEIKAQGMQSEINHQAQTITELRATNEDLRLNVASLTAAKHELDTQIVRIVAERQADAERFDSQLQLANERFRELEKSKLQELDNLRVQRQRAEADAASMKKELAEARIAMSNASIQAGEARGEAKALRSQVDQLNGQTVTLNRTIEEKLLEIQQMTADNRELRSEINRLNTQLVELQNTEGLKEELVQGAEGEVPAAPLPHNQG